MKNNILTLAVASCILISSAAHATNGMLLIGTGNKSRAMGGVAIAHPLDSLSGAANPATISGMADRFDIGMDFFIVDAEAQLGSVTAESKANINGMGLENTFIMPAMAITYQFNDDITLGFSMAPKGGGGTKYETNFFEAARAGTPSTPTINEKLGVDLLIMEMNPTIAYKLDDQNNVGLTLVIGVARFNAFGISLFNTFTQDQSTLEGFTNQGKDWTFGAGLRLGWMGDYGDLKLGATYSSEVNMKEFDKYDELFAEHGNIDVPAIAGLGISYRVMPELLLAMDITYTFYEDVPSIANTGPNLATAPSPLGSDDRKLGLPDGLGFGWENQTVIKVGAEYQYNDKTILRTGWNYGKSPINEEREIIFNTLAPATTQNHFTIGGTYSIATDMEINVSYIRAFEYEQSGPTYISDDGSNFGRIAMNQHSLGVSFSMNY
jgi:long-chain fatty acid transport protein